MFTAAVLILSPLLAWGAATSDYQRLDPSCTSCTAIDKLLSQHSVSLSPDKQLALALQIAKVIEHTHLKGKALVDQYRAIYFSLKGTIEVLDDDFDSETVVRLIDLRAQAPAAFDYVFWRFQLGNQKRIIERMQAAKSDGIRPKATIPPAHFIDSN
jgi:hypothetical protein